jgi:hypothetical protein
MRRLILGASSLLALAFAASAAPGCGSDDPGADPDGGTGGDACVGFGCTDPPPGDGGGEEQCVGPLCAKRVVCDGPDPKATALSGVVYDPAGKTPIYNATVYVPGIPSEIAAIDQGASCDRCDGKLSGSPMPGSVVTTDTQGRFTIKDVPVEDGLDVVVQLGKWRRQIKIPAVARCANTAVDATLTHLPKNRSEGDIPRIAITTGGADPLQCLLRKIGLDDAEFGVAGSDARVHLYKGGGVDALTASNQFEGGDTFPAANDLWSTKAELKKYDVVLLSCEGDTNEAHTDAVKNPAAKAALYDYAKEGGRIFASHYHHVWFSATDAPADVQGVAKWAPNPPLRDRQPPAQGDPATTKVLGDISTAFPKAKSMSEWLGHQQALESGKLPIYDARHNADGVNASGLSWITVPNPNVAAAPTAVQYMSFNTPVGAADDQVCGRVMYSNLHVASGQQGGTQDSAQDPFPTGCKTTDLTAQQKALIFMLFDLSSCVQKDDKPIDVPR